MPKELVEKRIWGPPGTGKTREVQHLFEKVYDEHGPDAALVVSFTKAAAQEIISRIPDTNKELVGTLHAICYRALGRPTIAETKLKDFTDAHAEYALSSHGSAVDLDNPYESDTRVDAIGDRWLQELNLLRAKRVDPLLWPSSVRTFSRVWNAWKEEMGYLDFTDLVEKCLTDVERAPHNPQIGIIDECFTGDTQVLLADGISVPIKVLVDYKRNDLVLSYNDRTGEMESQRIVGWHAVRRQRRALVRVWNAWATEDHPYYVGGGQYAPAGFIAAAALSDQSPQVLVCDGPEKEPRWIVLKRRDVEIKYLSSPDDETVYCIDVQHNHNFFAGRFAPVLVHNCQDCVSLHFALLRKWAQHMQYLMLVGDIEQSLYRFCGASPEDFVNNPVPPEHRKVLEQSHRVPRAVFAVASELRQQMTQREEGTYLPRDADGEVRRLEYSYRQPEPIIEEVIRDLNEGKTVMVLAACSYMLDPFKAMLKQMGVPFGNHYRPKRGDWNPLRSGNGTSGAERLAMFLRPEASVWGDERRLWTQDEVYQWTKLLKADGVFLPRVRIQMEAWKGSNEIATFIDMEKFLTSETVNDLIFSADLNWYEERLLATKLDIMQYPLAVARNCGGVALIKEPRLVIGTIHSVKGGQADVCYVFPDISRAGMREWMTPGAEHDAILRMFYVAVTRAYEKLTICQRASPWSVEV